MKFAYQIYNFACPCGNYANVVRFGTTSTGNLIVLWTCGKCGSDCAVEKPLDQVIAEIPEAPATFTEDDIAMLKRAKISMEGGNG